MRTLARYLACFFLVTTAGCASWFMKGEPPEVLVVNVTPLEAAALEQRLQVDLRIRNPNDFAVRHGYRLYAQSQREAAGPWIEQ